MSHFPILHFKLSKGYERLSLALRAQTELTLKEIDDLILIGAVYVDRRRCATDQSVQMGQYLRVHTRPRRFSLPTVDLSDLIVCETDEFIVANKPLGLPSHPTLDNSQENLLTILSKHCPVFLTHRLDQLTAGLILYAKTLAFQKRFSKWLEQRRVEKEYVALSENELPLGFHIHFMKPAKSAPRQVSKTPHPEWKNCELEILSSTKKEPGTYESRIQLITGRTHQIRAQLAAMGSPLLGDSLYGSTVPTKYPSLRAVKLEFPKTNGKSWCFHLDF